MRARDCESGWHEWPKRGAAGLGWARPSWAGRDRAGLGATAVGELRGVTASSSTTKRLDVDAGDLQPHRGLERDRGGLERDRGGLERDRGGLEFRLRLGFRLGRGPVHRTRLKRQVRR